MTKPPRIKGVEPMQAAPADIEARNAEIAALKADLIERHGAGRFTAELDDGMVFVAWTFQPAGD